MLAGRNLDVQRDGREQSVQPAADGAVELLVRRRSRAGRSAGSQQHGYGPDADEHDQRGDHDGDDAADAGSKTFEREHEMSLANNTRDMLVQAERALARIDNRTYGICENCGNPIGKARLQVFPRATLCMTCKQREERR